MPAIPTPATEPVGIAAGLVSLVGAVVVLLRSFGVLITDDQANAILGLVVVVGPMLAALWARRKVTPVEQP